MFKMKEEKIYEVLRAVAEDKDTPWQASSIVRVPGRYEVYALGTEHDVTMLVWIHDDGSTSIKKVCW